MSTLTISPAFVSGSTRAPRLSLTAARSTVRLTQRGRVVVLFAFLIAALVVMMSLSGWATATHEGGTPEQVRMVEVGAGDTLYKIAGEVAAPGEIREMVHHIQELNSLSGAGLVIGQKIAVPLG